MNIIRALGAEAKEDVISNLLVYCFNESPAFRHVFLRTVLGCEPNSYDHCTAETRIRTSLGVPDAAFVCRRKSDTDLIILENKLNAEEGIDQAFRFADPQCAGEVGRALGVEDATPLAPVFLALSRHQRPADPRFRFVIYRELLDALGGFKGEPDTLAARLIGDLVAVMTDFYAAATPSESEIVSERIRSWDGNTGLDAAHAWFVEAFGNLSPSPEIIPGDIGAFNMPGSKTSFVQYTKPHWRPAAFRDAKGSDFRANQHFDIHFEIAFNRKTIRLVLHHHTRHIGRYISKGAVATTWGASAREEFARYRAARDAFFDRLAAAPPAGFKCEKNDLQLASAPLQTEDRPLREVRVEAEDLIRVAAGPVEAAIAAVNRTSSTSI